MQLHVFRVVIHIAKNVNQGMQSIVLNVEKQMEMLMQFIEMF